MLWLLISVLAASVLGSLHCIGMCGPFALLAGAHHTDKGMAPRPSSSGLLPQIAAYHGGRLTTYLIIGALSGGLGMLVDLGASWYGWQRAASYLAGGLMIAVGLAALARYLGWTTGKVGVPNWVGGVVQRGFRWAMKWPPQRRAWLIGAVTTWMPCGWLYAFALTAAGVGHPLGSALVMAVFWLGSIPALFAVAWGFGASWSRLRLQTPVVTACVVIVAGLFTLSYRAPIDLAGTVRPVESQIDELIEHVQSLDHRESPCCPQDPAR